MTASKQDQLLVDWFCIPERGEDTAKPMRERVKPSLVAGAVAFVERGQFCEACQTWRAEDHPDRAPRTGRPLTLTDRHVLVALLVLGLLGEPPSLKRVSELLQYRLHTESRDLLGLPRAERVSAHAHYHRVARAYTRLCALFDPKVYPTHRRLTRAAVQAITDTFDPAVVARKQQRADWLANKILDLTVQMTPHELLGPWTGDITLDGTKLPVWGKHGHAGTKSAKPDDLMSPEVTAGFHAKSQDNRDKANTVGQTDKTEYTFAHEAHWRTAYAPPRNEMEGKNQYIKDAQYEDIDNPGIRRYRGYGKQLLAVAVLLAASNIRALRTFLSKTDATSGSPPPKPKKGRPKNPGLDAYRLDPTGPPRIVAEPTAA